MDIKVIREKLTLTTSITVGSARNFYSEKVQVIFFQSESVAEYEHDVDECCRLLEHKLELEMEKKLQLSNRIDVVQSQVTELWDRVDKARRRESDISCRVTAWAQHLSEMMNEVLHSRQKIMWVSPRCERGTVTRVDLRALTYKKNH